MNGLTVRRLCEIKMCFTNASLQPGTCTTAHSNTHYMHTDTLKHTQTHTTTCILQYDVAPDILLHHASALCVDAIVTC